MKQHHANEDGWSDWETPVMDGFRMACCDCGLVHDVDFLVLEVTKKNDDGSWESVPLDKDKYRVSLRMRRNNRSTGQMRRRK